jgi:hypothetical protein
MPAAGTMWKPNFWGVDVWAANFWADAEAAVVVAHPIRAELSVSSRPATIGVTSRTPTITQGDA